jgi:putative oxidoreductase
MRLSISGTELRLQDEHSTAGSLQGRGRQPPPTREHELMNTVAAVMAGALGAFFLAAGGFKLAGATPAVDNFRHWRYPDWMRVFTGVWETAGALLLVIGIWHHGVALAGAAIVGISMFGAVYTHTLRVPEGKALAAAAVPLVTALGTIVVLAVTV